ncbi:MAG: GWxTD domain-containing protein [Owenweeksia sp.]|nr:GWxTD domain-containing protein [Owenweeksia sp.]
MEKAKSPKPGPGPGRATTIRYAWPTVNSDRASGPDTAPDRGRVFLVYGKPDMIDSRKLEPNMPAYEMWQYNLISTPYSMRQTNRLFVFAEFEPSTNEYQLFHSTAIGELSSRRWRYDMKMRYSGASGNINSQRDMGYPTDPFGTRTEDNIIINSTGSDRENR